MTTPRIQALGITQQWSTTNGHATGDVDGVGWLEAWGTTLLVAMEALRAPAIQRVHKLKNAVGSTGERCRLRRRPYDHHYPSTRALARWLAAEIHVQWSTH